MRYLPLYLCLLACNSSSSKLATDASISQYDGHHLIFDASLEDTTLVLDDANNDALTTADSETDTIADAILLIDIIQNDLPLQVQTDVGPQCDGPGDNCGAGTICQMCYTYFIENDPIPANCNSDPAWLHIWHCILGF